MKSIFGFFIAVISLLSISSCKYKNTLPHIEFKTGGTYYSSNSDVIAGQDVKIGIFAYKTEERGLLKTFTILKSIDGVGETEVHSQTLSGNDAGNFVYEYNSKVGSVSGQKEKYVFRVENKYGMKNEVALTFTIQ